jgi:hypothetical protein
MALRRLYPLRMGSRRACLGLIAVVALLGAAQAPPSLAASGPRSGYYVMRRADQLEVELIVERGHITGVKIEAAYRCANGEESFLGVGSGAGIRSGRYGRFYYHSEAEQEGEGSGEETMSGRITGNLATGTFSAWEEADEEEAAAERGEPSPPRCGTGGPDGREMHFTARRVSRTVAENTLPVAGAP